MIEGRVNQNDEAVIELVLYDDQGRPIKIYFVLDTGFTDTLAVPPSVIGRLNWPAIEGEVIEMADGRSAMVSVHKGDIMWDGERIEISAYALDGRPLIGMKLLRGNLVTMEVMPDGLLTIEPAT